MAKDPRHTPKPQNTAAATPFDSAEDAWFWFIKAQQARIDGARFSHGLGVTARPCEPVDILQVVDRLYRQKNLTMDHLLVLRHYGRRMLPPDPRRAKEIRAWRLWTEALVQLAPPLEAKKIIRPQGMFPPWLMKHNIVSLDLYRGAAE
jgi:hypothetical protein